jgi:hypothetical protein
LPQHRDTYRVTPENRFCPSGYPYEVRLRLSKPLQARYHILEHGKKLLIERKSTEGGSRKSEDHPNRL